MLRQQLPAAAADDHIQYQASLEKSEIITVSLCKAVTQRLVGIITLDIFPEIIQRHGIEHTIRQIDLGCTLLTEILPLHR